MWKRITQIHRFLLSQMIYPLILSTGLAILIYLGRVYQSRSLYVHANLIWNLFLAWLPYIFSFSAAAINRLFPRQWWLLLVPGGLWLIFFPNAPYIVTDFLHLEERPFVPLWYDILLIATFAWTGIFLAVSSMRTMQLLIKRYLGWIVSWLFVGGALGLGGLGIYLGRFQRWNTWDLFFHPRGILADIATRMINPTDHLRFFVFSLLFTAFLFVCYLTFISVHKASEAEE
jgi:uncharacterized membrane protein